MDQNVSKSVWIHSEYCNKIRHLLMLQRGCLLAFQDSYYKPTENTNKNIN